MQGNLLTVKEVAKYLRVSERSVLRYIDAGKLNASKVGLWRVKETDLKNFLKKTGNRNNKKRYA